MKKETICRQRSCHWIATTVLSLFTLFPTYAQRQSQTINDSWKFLREECPAAADSAFDDHSWTDIHLPHTWNTDAYTEKDYYRGTGWYRRTLRLPQEWQGKQLFLKLEAASKAATLYVNGDRKSTRLNSSHRG